MKRILLSILLSLFFVIVFPIESNAAADNSKIILDGEELILPDKVQVANVNKSVMIPIRVVAESLKFKVDWDQKSRNVKIQQNARTLSLTVDQKEALVDNNIIELNNAPLIMNNTVVVPIRFVSEQMGLEVSWDNTDKIVYLTRKNSETSSENSSTGIVQDTTSSVKRVNEINFSSNQLVIAMDSSVTPVISTLKNPDRVVIDLPNTTFGNVAQSIDSSSNGKLDVSAFPAVADIRYSLFSRDPDQVRIVIELVDVPAIGFSYETSADKILVNLNVTGDGVAPAPQNPVSYSETKVVVIDPGHGGKDPGTTGINNYKEKDFTLAVALKVQALLLQEPEIEVIMTRETDVYPTRPERVQLANQLNANVFVSIHGNSVLSSPQTTGTETFYYQRSNSKELADVIHKHLVAAMGLKDRGVKNGNYEVIRETKMAAVLLEVGFLSNIYDEEIMLSESGQNAAAQAIVDGIKEYLGVVQVP
ncbi:N-acetylmuramoyl-L-alanine amidase [Fontibacillus solani]|uniref:N-acetylmuramoyl-L-alanine amidase n=1 Tax=Fontibacillus solani TaxID=1572857 RepID=A0A7W3SVN3_9BACL|nr:N-acetylmuramoyl-L-alanine amidase family protein [Fontibacillus solani]MBA9087052.1 N-acetylmuramoyl-L-alanine amidase [Fontibacillus solani]